MKSALENFGGNYTEIEAAEIQEDIERIQDALQTFKMWRMPLKKSKHCLTRILLQFLMKQQSAMRKKHMIG